MFGALAALAWDVIFEHLFRHYAISSEIAMRHLALDGNGTLLDVGGGTGGVSARLRDRVKRSIVVDTSVDRVRRGARTHPGSRFVLAKGEALPLPDRSADAVLLVEVLHHVPDDRAVLAEVARVLRPGGRALIEESEFHGRYLYRYWFERLLCGGLWPRTRAGLRATLESLGFEVRPLEDEGFVMLATRRY